MSLHPSSESSLLPSSLVRLGNQSIFDKNQSEKLNRVQSIVEFNEVELSENNSNSNIRLTEFFKRDYGNNATRNRVISGNINNTNPFGFQS